MGPRLWKKNHLRALAQTSSGGIGLRKGANKAFSEILEDAIPGLVASKGGERILEKYSPE